MQTQEPDHGRRRNKPFATQALIHLSKQTMRRCKRRKDGKDRKDRKDRKKRKGRVAGKRAFTLSFFLSNKAEATKPVFCQIKPK